MITKRSTKNYQKTLYFTEWDYLKLNFTNLLKMK